MADVQQPIRPSDRLSTRLKTTWRMIFDPMYRKTTLRNLRVGRLIPPDVYEFWTWSRTAGTLDGVPVYDGNLFQQETGNDKPIERYVRWYASKTSTHERCALDLDRWYPPKLEGWPGLIALTIQARGETAMEVSDRKLISLIIVDFNQELTIRNCFIQRLEIVATNLVLRIENSVIGVLVWKTDEIASLDIDNTAIMDVNVESEPSGDVLIKRMWLARDLADGAGSIHHLRAVRTYLSSMNNAAAAGIFHSAELALERKYEARKWTKLVSWVYEFLSDYGNSIARPVIWFSVVYLIMFILALIPELVSTGTEGWQASPKDNWLLKAMLYPFLAIINPLGVFGKTLILTKCWVWSFVLTLISLVGTLCVAFFLIGIRRRFKLE